MAALLGCIADDFTGGTDLAGTLVKHGMRTVQMIGVPHARPCPDDVDAIVVALKSRTSKPEEAVRDSVGALRWLQKAGCKQFYFKYCSTFDSTPQGNIGPVTEALMDALNSEFTIACPAFPANRRTIYQGHLFVGDALLHESGMQDHPLTPMTDANLVRVLQRQVKRRVGLVDYHTVCRGETAVATKFAELRDKGFGLAVVDAVSDPDLSAIGAACAGLVLVTAGSGLAVGLPENFHRQGLLARHVAADALPITGGPRAVVAGSCSRATQAQVALMRKHHPAFHVDAVQVARGSGMVAAALEWAADNLRDEPVLIYATAGLEEVKAAQAELGVERAGELVENALAAIARGLVGLGVGRLIVAGGETSGAVVKALRVEGLRIGPEIDPGVPWTVTLQPAAPGQALALALKSGNFGTDDFFLKAWRYLS